MFRNSRNISLCDFVLEGEEVALQRIKIRVYRSIEAAVAHVHHSMSNTFLP